MNKLRTWSKALKDKVLIAWDKTKSWAKDTGQTIDKTLDSDHDRWKS